MRAMDSYCLQQGAGGIFAGAGRKGKGDGRKEQNEGERQGMKNSGAKG